MVITSRCDYMMSFRVVWFCFYQLENLINQIRRTESGSELVLNCWMKLGRWTEEILQRHGTMRPEDRFTLLRIFREAKESHPQSYRAWHEYGLANYQALEDFRAAQMVNRAAASNMYPLHLIVSYAIGASKVALKVYIIKCCLLYLSSDDFSLGTSARFDSGNEALERFCVSRHALCPQHVVSIRTLSRSSCAVRGGTEHCKPG